MSAADVCKISVKFFVEDSTGVGAHEFVPVLHSWIQNHAVPEHTLIDVADYAHVHNGPGTVLVAHEAIYSTDRTDGQLGLTYFRKLSGGATLADRLRQAFAAALEGCARLEDDPRLSGKIKFRTDECSVRFNDRLLAPNSPETFSQAKPDLERVAGEMYAGASVDIEHYFSQNLVFEVRIRADDSPTIATLLNRLGRSAAAPS